jgi:polar amino acid transport system substrate-binding protein
VALLGALVLTSGCISEPEDVPMPPAGLVYYTEQLPPYNYEENGTLQGISVDMLEAVTERMGVKVSREEVHLAPWTEGYQAVLTQNNTVLFSMARTPEREDMFKWAGPIYTNRKVLFARPDSGIIVDGPEDLGEYRIGVITDDIAIQYLLDMGVDQSRIVTKSNMSALITALDNGDIDLWACPEASGRYFTEQATGNYYSYRIVYQLHAQETYYAFSKDIPDSVVDSFQQALDDFKQEKDVTGISVYERVLGRHYPSVGLAQLDYLTEEMAPFNYQEDGNVTGISVDILEAVFLNIGVNRTQEDVRIVPWNEGYEAARSNTGTVLFSMVRTPEREQSFKWAGPFTKMDFVVFTPMSSNIIISSPEELNNYRIGVVEDSIENDLLFDHGVNSSGLVLGQTPGELSQMLEDGQIDLWATGALAGRYQMMQDGDLNAYEDIYTLGEKDLYYGFSSDVPDALVSAFQQALATVRNQKDEQGISEYERIIYRNLGVGCARQTFTDGDVISLVDTTAAAIGKNATDTLRRISAGEAPYRNLEDSGLYVFVYDIDLTMVAHADNILLVGNNFKGKTDVTGKPFRDEIKVGALTNGTGWVDYVYVHPVWPNLYYKATYYRLTTGNDGISYIVCSGNFKSCGV